MTNVSVINIFTPAQEIQESDRFAGRSEQLEDLSTALQSRGAQIVMYGQRGVGKSSLARQLQKLAVNDKAVVQRLEHEPTAPLDYLPVFVACDDSVGDINRLLIRLLNDDEALAPWVPFKVVEKSSSSSLNPKFSVKVIELGGEKSDALIERARETEADLTSVFINACKELVRSGVAKDGLLIIVDEFDRIKNRSGLASLMKTLGPEGVTFALVGVATTIQDLVTDHESVARQLADGAIPVHPMSEDELNEIFDRAEALLGKTYKFAESARNWVIEIARGHPFYVHLLGKHSLIAARAKGVTEIDEEISRSALAEIALKGSAPIQESAYKTAIGHSYTRELILKRFAEKLEDEIHTTELYAGLAKELKIEPSAVSVYVGHLTSERYGEVLVKTRDRYYRFRDSLFKAYAAARPFELNPFAQEDA